MLAAVTSSQISIPYHRKSYFSLMNSSRGCPGGRAPRGDLVAILPLMAVPAETSSASQPALGGTVEKAAPTWPGLSGVGGTVIICGQQFPGTMPHRLTAAHPGGQVTVPATQLKKQTPKHATCSFCEN